MYMWQLQLSWAFQWPLLPYFVLIQPLSYNIVDYVFAAKILNLLWDQSIIKKLNSFDIITLWEWIVVIRNEFTSFYVEYFHSHFQANCVNKIYMGNRDKVTWPGHQRSSSTMWIIYGIMFNHHQLLISFYNQHDQESQIYIHSSLIRSI